MGGHHVSSDLLTSPQGQGFILRSQPPLTKHVAIVWIPRRLPLDTLLEMEQLFGMEDALYEKVLQRLVGVIDAKLLERVVLKRFKAKQIEEPDAES